MYYTYPAQEFGIFLKQLQQRALVLLHESRSGHCVFPVGLLLVIDQKHGGDKTAQELVKRFFLLDKESAARIDFYYLGWGVDKGWIDRLDPEDLKFDLEGFVACREILKKAGVKEFGGNADLILVDAIADANEVHLRFDEAVGINLSKATYSGQFGTLGQFLEDLLQAAEELNLEGTNVSPSWKISDKLGIAYAKESLLQWVLDKWGAFIGAKQLRGLAVRNIGPRIKLSELLTFYNNELKKSQEQKDEGGGPQNLDNVVSSESDP